MSYNFGVSNHSPDQVLVRLQRAGIIHSLNEVSVLPYNGVLNTRPKNKIVFIICLSDYKHNMRYVNSDQYQAHTFFVFSSPLRLAELQGVHALDFTPDPAYKGHGFLLGKLNLSLYRLAMKKRVQAPVVRANEDFLVKMISNVIKGSLLNPLMTFIYTLPSATHQTPVKLKIAQWLYNSRPVSELSDHLDSIEQVSVTQRIKDRLKLILDSEIGRNFQAAFAEYRKEKKAKKTVNLASICKRHDVDPYEARYILSVLDERDKHKAASKYFTSHKEK